METLVLPAQDHIPQHHPGYNRPVTFQKTPRSKKLEDYSDANAHLFLLVNMSAGILPAPSPASFDVISSSASHYLSPLNHSILHSFPSLSANASSCSTSAVFLCPQPFTPHTYFPALSDSATSLFELAQVDLPRSTCLEAFGRSPEIVKDDERVVAARPGYLPQNVSSTGLRHKKKKSSDLNSLSQRRKSRSRPSNYVQCKWTVKNSTENGDAGKTDKEKHREFQQDKNKHIMEFRPRIHSHQSSNVQGFSEKEPSTERILSIAAAKFAKETTAVTDEVSSKEGESKSAAARDFPFLRNSSRVCSMTKPQVEEAAGSNLSKLLRMDITKKETDSYTKMPNADNFHPEGSFIEYHNAHDADVLVSEDASAIFLQGNESSNFMQEFEKSVRLYNGDKKEFFNPTGILNQSDFKRRASTYDHPCNYQIADNSRIVDAMLEDTQSTIDEFSPTKKALHCRVGECDVESTLCTSAAATLVHVSSGAPSPRYHSTRAVKIKNGRGALNQNYNPFFGHLPSEKWAGPAYSNSPPPSSLPLPNFPHQRLRTAHSMEIFALEAESAENIHSSLCSCSLSAPSSPRSPDLSELHSGPEIYRNRWDTAFATKNLRRILNLDSA